MNIDLEQLAKEEVQRLVKEKINGKLHQQIQKELKSYEYTRMISDYVRAEMKNLIENIDLLEYIDKEKLQADVTYELSSVLMNRLTTSHSYEEY
ncbi:hypothetical protein D7X33_32735 [Butyricicoccus sp. 1XD8-22]|nr:hypothetical protein D7X33_32735 [Butyricicoccus sp. 1XD8-22]